MRVLILGGDGYLGQPTAMHLTSRAYEATVADSFLIMMRDLVRCSTVMWFMQLSNIRSPFMAKAIKREGI